LPGTAWTGHSSLESGFFHVFLSAKCNSRPKTLSSRCVNIQYDNGSIWRRLMRNRGRIGSLLLGLFVGLSIIAAMSVSPANAQSPTYSCSVSVTHTSTAFYVKTTTVARGGYLQGPTETDNIRAYVNGHLYNTQSSTYTIAANISSITITIPIAPNGSGSYIFQSAILNNKGVQLTSCTGTYKL
jgi:hypothetical protein